MATPITIRDIDLSPLPGKRYFTCEREWREEFIYFLLVDRFHDDAVRAPVRQCARSPGISVPPTFVGGTLKGITRHLDYIAGLGCTAIWLSPIFENNPDSYHGYDINNYLAIDPHFGTKQDLVDLVKAAHGYRKNGEPFPIRVILDVVLNHSGDNWMYPSGDGYNYSDDQRFDFGGWRRDDRPIPIELRNPDFYHRRGSIQQGWDTYPELQHGDLYGLKDYANDDDEIGAAVVNTLIAAHCYWIREADVDGFRVDAVKHMGELACAGFCTGVREYASALGKRGFFLFGEVASPDDAIIDRYIGPNTSQMYGSDTVFIGLDSVLDFRLAESAAGGAPLRDVIKGFAGPQALFDRLEAQRQRALHEGEVGRYLVTFVDNHDAFWQSTGRIGAGAPDAQVIAAIGYLLCALGTACLYYGTEQGFEGKGGDTDIREAMFDPGTSGRNLHNSDCTIYQEIAKIAAVHHDSTPLRFGRMYYREISADGIHFGLPYGTDYTLAFSRTLYGREVLVAYNVSHQARQDCVIVDGALHEPGDRLTYLYGGVGDVAVEGAPSGARFLRLDLDPHQFVILA